uniref:MgsA AAA+ ATPase C-terminal domain-containing protein n=1 Tax=Octopus bimaculoides TaxID=37653 RepID=A0A0L8H5N9_OCTBM
MVVLRVHHLFVWELPARMSSHTACRYSVSGRPNVWINNKVIEEIAFLCDGDGRVALNCLQMAVQSQIQKNEVDTTEYSPTIIDVDCVKESLERSCILYDKKGEEHYNCASALQKSIRGSDPDAALYWMARMLEGGEDPLFIARRLVRTASEDIGLADPLALTQAVAAFQATNFIGKPECDVILAQCAVYLARAPKSVEVYSAYTKAKQCILEHRGPLPSVPLHLRNATTGLMKSLVIVIIIVVVVVIIIISTIIMIVIILIITIIICISIIIIIIIIIILFIIIII